MNNKTKPCLSWVRPVIVAGLLSLPVSVPAADVDCGAVLTGNVTLTGGTLAGSYSGNGGTPCTESPMVTLDGATLDLNGYAIEPADDPNGIGVQIVGKGSTLRNGTIYASGDNYRMIDVQGEGRNKLEKLAIHGGGPTEFASTAEKNTLESVHLNFFDSVTIPSGGNKLSDVSLTNHVGSGTASLTISGDKNKLARIRGNYGGGVAVVGDKNSIVDLVLANCTSGDGSGIDVDGNKNRIKGNVVHGCSMHVAGDGNRVDRNVSAFCTGGIEIEDGSGGNEINRNVVIGATTDMVDANASCGTNDWSSNVFSTSDVAAGGADVCLE